MSFPARVDPRRIVIESGCVRPSGWDSVAVLDDLRAFVTVSRLIKATPVLELVDGVLRLVSGEPFVRAAQEAEPPLEEIVCLIKADRGSVGESSLFVPVNPADLMKEHSEQDPYEAFEMLTFVLPVTAEVKAEIEQEIVVADALRSSGTDVVVTSPSHDVGVDLAVWSDVLEPFVGNPLLIEVKGRIRGKTEAKQVLRQLASYVSASGSQWGLLLYGDGPDIGGQPSASTFPNVLVLSLRSLLENLRTRAFPELIRDLRNRRVHGASS